jgi:hypothetical protein
MLVLCSMHLRAAYRYSGVIESLQSDAAVRNIRPPGTNVGWWTKFKAEMKQDAEHIVQTQHDFEGMSVLVWAAIYSSKAALLS